MTHRFRLTLLAGVCTLPVLAMPAHAQDSSQEDSSNSATNADRNVIIVTANKRDENLQEVPISITAFSQEDLDKRGDVGLAGIQEATPNLNFSVQSAGQNVARVTLRGVGTETLVGGGDPGVALHIDGVYVGRNSAAAGDIFDVARVEVLRGPQGTLYGRNATGGSINIITQRPTQELGGHADITYGNYNALRIRGVANVPLTDTVSSRIALFADSHDGYMENQYEPGRDSSDKDSFGGRAQILWEPNNTTEVLVRGYYLKSGGTGPGTRFLGTDIDTDNGYPAAVLAGVADGTNGPIGTPLVLPLYTTTTTITGESVADRPTGFYEFSKDAPEFVDTLIKGIDLEASFDVSDSMLLRSITSYQTNNNEILVDADNSELDIETRQRASNAEQFSQEFNLISQGDSRFQWLLGAYYYHEELTEAFTAITPANSESGATGVAQQRVADNQSDSYALFGQVSYDLTDSLKLTAGLRHTWDEKAQQRSEGGFVDITNNLRFLGDGAIGPEPASSGQASFAEFTYRVSLAYQVSADSNLFASYSRGYKSGGFDFNGGTLFDDGTQIPYQPEFVNAFEVGSKNRFFDGSLLFNLTGFYYDYTDLQVFRLTLDGPLTDNAAQSTIWGVELESALDITDAFTVEATIGYLDATYDEYSIDIPPTDFSGNRLNYAPEWTVHVAGEYTMPVGTADLTARVDYSYRSKTFFDRGNTALDTQPAYGLLNAKLRYDAETFYVDLFGRNLTDVEYVTGQLINPPFSCDCRTVNLGNPRTYGVTFGVRY